MFSGVAEYLDEQIAGAVSDFGLVGKVRRAIDVNANANDAGDVVDAAGDSRRSG